MKAFQLKIMIKNSKPPIWRRVIVPAGITFSQLSIILNKVMGWCGYHQFEFDFYHQGIRVIEGANDFSFGFAPYDYLEASTTYIREYLEGNEWFSYVYDLGDYWDHRVTVEKVMDDYTFNYPKVIKYKGDCPVEDCGGIDGYYECLEIIQDESHPEYEDRLAWLEMQGYPNEFDLEWINEELESELFYQWGKGEDRCQNQIYEELLQGNCGLRAAKDDRNYDCTLAGIFADFTKDDIRDIAKSKGLRGISGCTKEQLIEKLSDFMLRPQVLRSYFLCLQDREIEEFEYASEEGFYDSEQIEYLQNLYAAAYIGMLSDGRVRIPQAVFEVYREISDEVFHAKRKEISFVLGCLRTVGMLHGIAPTEVVLKMVNQHPELNLSAEDLEADMESLPPEFSEFVLAGDRVYHKMLYPDDRGLQKAQGNKAYYIPTMDEISDMGIYGYFPNHAESVRFRQYLEKSLGADKIDAELAVEMIQRKICGDCQIEEVYEILEDFDLEVDAKPKFRELAKRVDALWNDTRMLLNRGFTPNEMARKKARPIIPMAQSDNIIDLQIVRKNKIYPNEPCPCGSGKKYKNCCGR